MNLPRTAIFIEPQGTLRTSLIERKKILELAMPGQAYTSHPPHSTLLFGEYGSPEIWTGKLRAAVNSLPPFRLATDAWQEFPNDLQAAGGHTVAYRVKLSPELLRLQLTIAEVVAPFRESSSLQHPLADREPFASSLKHFGFPFVGPHWIPHFTIGSPRLPANDPLLASLMNGSPIHELHVNTISIWQVMADHHNRLTELALTGTAG
ncbi:hypothetical protein CMV30_12615 [Nibricoccus aquaticus]|uniref:Uncharacterized protein n=1 Tax=Nibricoccus aquaticus TaxID=2576891 RepID=A0A290Q7P3_9BACT|nr:2'-5' RNA ligase family protein [Nibricoccus aquaticus]ATC64735.1 hypothetical protein CMV30_12615 [Nibricoccus aquaticus]